MDIIANSLLIWPKKIRCYSQKSDVKLADQSFVMIKVAFEPADSSHLFE